MKTKKPEQEKLTVIHTYSRTEAIADGALIDVTPLAEELFSCPVAITQALWQGYIAPPADLEPHGQTVEGRLWHMLTMLYVADRQRRAADIDTTTLPFFSLFKQDHGPHQPASLKAVTGYGDSGEIVMTIMLADED